MVFGIISFFYSTTPPLVGQVLLPSPVKLKVSKKQIGKAI